MRLKAIVGSCVVAATVIAGVVPAGSAGAAPARTSGTGPRAGQHFRTITLITGDRLSVATDGSQRFAVVPTPGREQAQFVTRVVAGHLEVTPVDALPLVKA